MIMVAGVVGFTGTIGFIRLVGAVLLVLADTTSRSVVSPMILPVGSATVFFGVPLFVYLIIKRKGGFA